MSEKDPKRLYFDVPSENTVTILNYELKETDFGTEKRYTIKEIIDTGYNYFIASDGLHNKINALNVTAGDIILIKKLQLEQYADGNPFFKVEMAHNQPIKAENPVKQFEGDIEIPDPDRKEQHDIMWKKHLSETADKGDKPGDEDLPF